MTLVIGSVASCSEMFPIHHGNGKLIIYEKNVSPFEKIDCSGSAHVHYYASDEYRAVVTVDANLEDFTEVYVRNKTLHIRSKSGYVLHCTKFLVEVYCPVLTDVFLSGSGNFNGMDIIVTSSFATSISGSGNIYGTIECDNFSTKMSGSGKVELTGAAKDANIVISGSGKFSGSAFLTKEATVIISGSGIVDIWVENHLKANISGSGNINYRGEPTIVSSISGSGHIRKI